MDLDFKEFFHPKLEEYNPEKSVAFQKFHLINLKMDYFLVNHLLAHFRMIKLARFP